MKLLKIKTLIMAQNMERAVAFYEQVFGMQCVCQTAQWSELSHGDSIIGLHGGGDGTRNSTDLSFEVDNIVAACRRIRESGGRVVSEPDKRQQEPIVLAIFRDTEGNELMLTQYVG
jgi:predicted enzyme related to lactoylglutathione lyase